MSNTDTSAPPERSTTRRDSPRTRLPQIIACAAIAFILAMIAVRWDSRTGLTSLLRFGADYEARQIPAVADLPLAIKPNRGYDGQFYAQLAVSPTPTDPHLQQAMDNPGYRMRRALLPFVAHALGGGDAWRTMHVYVTFNILAWLIACGLLWRIVAPVDLAGTGIWLGCVLGLGVLDSVRMALTDLPALLLTLIAIRLMQRARTGSAVGVLAVAALVRETAVFSTAALDTRPWGSRASWGVHARHLAFIALPIALWTAWLLGRVSGDDPLGRNNFDWPCVAIVEHATTWIRALASGDLDTRNSFGLLAIVSFSWQSIAVLRQARSTSPWVRMALPFAALYWVLGDAVWHGYWAVARACLPMTIAYNLTLPRDRSFWWQWALGNVCLLHAVWRFLPE